MFLWQTYYSVKSASVFRVLCQGKMARWAIGVFVSGFRSTALFWMLWYHSFWSWVVWNIVLYCVDTAQVIHCPVKHWKASFVEDMIQKCYATLLILCTIRIPMMYYNYTTVLLQGWCWLGRKYFSVLQQVPNPAILSQHRSVTNKYEIRSQQICGGQYVRRLHNGEDVIQYLRFRSILDLDRDQLFTIAMV